MCFVNGNIAKEVIHLHDWQDHLWTQRYKHVLISHETEAQVHRLRYVLRHGAKENLVAKPGVGQLHLFG